jgi:hypothetical protein
VRSKPSRLPGHHVDRNRGLGDLYAELEQLAMDLGSAPERVLKTHSSDQVAHLFADPRSTPKRSGLPSPISGKTHSMPTHNRLGPDDGYGVKNARTATIEPNEQGSVSPTQIQSAWRALLQNIELMPQYQVFGFELASRLEAVARRPIAIIRRSCSDSLMTASQIDRVFGSDRRSSRPRSPPEALTG